jgi:cytochrome c peroxidase
MKRSAFAVLSLASLALAACAPEPLPPPSPAPAGSGRASSELVMGRINPRLLNRFRRVAPQHAPPAATPALVSLGRMLWYDARLSRGGQVSCESCHRLAGYGVDGLPRSRGHEGRIGRRNAPTVYNAAEHFAQFWDGRTGTIEEQALGPLLNPLEMASTRASIESTLRAIPGYREAFRSAFLGPDQAITVEAVGVALGAFERGLTTSSRWDAYLAGDTKALSPAELQGLRTFLTVGCVGCHTGNQVGGSMFQRAGLLEPWPSQTDQGRYEITRDPSERMVFKVPTLRNISRTGPYFHDGSCATLPEAVQLMAHRQLGVDLSLGEVAAIVTFLEVLTGELPAGYVARPTLPPGPSLAANAARAGAGPGR